MEPARSRSERFPSARDSSARTRPRPEHEGQAEFEQRLRWRARGIERRLACTIVGQDRAVAAVARAVERGASGLAAPGRPLANLLFLGRTGTGKTALAETLSREIFGGDRGSLVRIDCGEYALPHEHARLIGSPPGFVGHEEGGHLGRALLENPARVVLFDEVEKAHPRLHGVLLSILDEGALTDGRGLRVSFERSIVILTSNAGAFEMSAAARAVGFERAPVLGPERLRAIALEALERRFSPELLGRLDETIVFEELDLQSAERIARTELKNLAMRSRRAGLRVAFRPDVARWIAERGFSPEHGARGIVRAIRKEIEAPLADVLLDPRLAPLRETTREPVGRVRAVSRRKARPLARARIEDGRAVFDLET